MCLLHESQVEHAHMAKAWVLKEHCLLWILRRKTHVAKYQFHTFPASHMLLKCTPATPGIYHTTKEQL